MRYQGPRIVHLHSDIHTACEVCQEFLGLDLAQTIGHYEARHGYVLLSEFTQTLPGPSGQPRETEIAVLRHSARRRNGAVRDERR